MGKFDYLQYSLNLLVDYLLVLKKSLNIDYQNWQGHPLMIVYIVVHLFFLIKIVTIIILHIITINKHGILKIHF